MQYFKTLEGMLTAAFEERGMTLDNGQPIKATEQPMTEQEYRDYKKEEVGKKVTDLVDRTKKD